MPGGTTEPVGTLAHWQMDAGKWLHSLPSLLWLTFFSYFSLLLQSKALPLRGHSTVGLGVTFGFGHWKAWLNKKQREQQRWQQSFRTSPVWGVCMERPILSVTRHRKLLSFLQCNLLHVTIENDFHKTHLYDKMYTKWFKRKRTVVLACNVWLWLAG